MSGRWSGFTLALWVLFLVNSVAVNLLLGATEPARLHKSSLTKLDNFAHFVQGNDSWKPMGLALSHLESHPDDSVYEGVLFSGRSKFQYPPSSLMPIWLLRRMLPSHRAVWMTLTVTSWLSMILLAVLCARILGLSGRRHEFAPASDRDALARGSAAFVLALSFYPAIQAYSLGQIQAWINALFAVLVWLWLSGRAGAAGVVAGVMSLIKPQYGLLLLWSILRKRWSFASACAVTLAVGGTASLILFGGSNHVEYVDVLAFLARRGESYYANQSVNGLLHRVFFNGDNLRFHGDRFPPYHLGVHVGTIASSLLLVGLALWGPIARAHRGGVVDLLIAALTCTLATPIAWDHHYGVLLPVYAFLAPVVLREGRGRGAFVLLALSYVLSSNYYGPVNRLADSAWNVAQSYLLAGALAALACLYAVGRSDGSRASARGDRSRKRA